MGRQWTPADDSELRALYAAGHSRHSIADQLGRTIDAVDARRRLLGEATRRPIQRAFTANEDRFLRGATDAGVPRHEIARRLGRSFDVVRKRGEQLAIMRPAPRRYLPREDDQIRATVNATLSLSDLARELCRSEDALRLRARKLGLLAAPQRRRWSQSEDDRLREGYNAGLAAKQIRSDFLPERTAAAITRRASLLGLATYARRWTDDEEQQLASFVAALYPLDAIAKTLHRSREAITCRCRRLQLPVPASTTLRARARWTEREDHTLRTQGTDTLALARTLGRPEQAIRRRQRLLGLETVHRSQHHAHQHQQREVVPGQRRQLARELPLTPRRALAVAARLKLPLVDLQRLAKNATKAPPATGD